MRIRQVATSAPLNWFKLGWQGFKANPGTWIAITLIQVVLSLVTNMHPLLSFVYMILVPFFTAGMYLCARLAHQQQAFNTDNFFSVFKQKDKYLPLLRFAMLQIGISIILQLAIMPFVSAMSDQASADAMSLTVTVLFILAMVSIVVFLLFFLLPLIYFEDDIDLFSAMKMSLEACWKNIWPLTVYGVIAFTLLVLAFIPMALGLLIVAPLLVNAQYHAYLEIFEKEVKDSAGDEGSENDGADKLHNDVFEA